MASSPKLILDLRRKGTDPIVRPKGTPCRRSVEAEEVSDWIGMAC